MQEKNSKENLIKQVCNQLGLSYRQLAEKIGYSESSISNAAATGKISKQLEQAILLYLDNLKLQKEVEKLHQLKKLLKDILE